MLFIIDFCLSIAVYLWASMMLDELKKKCEVKKICLLSHRYCNNIFRTFVVYVNICALWIKDEEKK